MGNTVNRALDNSAIHTLIFRPRTAQARLARAELVHHGDRHAPGHRPLSNMLDRPSWRQITEPSRLGTVAPLISPLPLSDKALSIVSMALSVLVLAKKLALSHLSVCVNGTERVIVGDARLDGKNKLVHRFHFERGQRCKNVLRSFGARVGTYRRTAS